jgi:Tol biopolymer transport system component
MNLPSSKNAIQAPETQGLQMQPGPAGTQWLAAICATLMLCTTHCSDLPERDHTDPTPAASNGIVLVREVDGSSELIWVRLSDGSERTLTATPKRNERWPYWSSAAKRLVFQREAVGGGNSDLLIWRPEAGDAVPLRQSDRRDERWPTWSPDGERLVYAFRGAGNRAGIAVDRVDGGATQVLAISRMKDYFFRPSFSPDGSKLVAQRRGPDGVGSNLWILAPNRVPRQLTDDPQWFDMKPWFTRGGDRVVFSRRPVSGERRDIAIITLDTGAIRTIASLPDADDHSARPSPTRDEIAFSSDRNGKYDIFMTDLNGATVRALASFRDRNAHAPRWSPDGERLVITVADTADQTISNSHVVVIKRDGDVELDVPGAMADWMPAW